MNAASMADAVATMLADSEADLRERFMRAEAERDVYREMALEAIRMLHERESDLMTTRRQVAALRDELRRYTGRILAVKKDDNPTAKLGLKSLRHGGRRHGYPDRI